MLLGVIETKIPSRLDRLPWSRFHWRIVLGLGTAWVLDRLEVLRADRAPLHEAWAAMHEERALAFESRAQGRDGEAAAHDQAADREAAKARAISCRLEAAEDDGRIRARLARQRERQLRAHAATVPGRVGSAAPRSPDGACTGGGGARPRDPLHRAGALRPRSHRSRGARPHGRRSLLGTRGFAEALRQAVADGNVFRLTRRVYSPASTPQQEDGDTPAVRA